MITVIWTAIILLGGTACGVSTNSDLPITHSDCSTCFVALSKISEALKDDDKRQITKLLNCLWAYAGIDACADDLCIMAGETKDERMRMLFDSYLCTVPRIVLSKYGSNMLPRALDALFYTEGDSSSDSVITTMRAKAILERAFRFSGSSCRPLIVYMLVRSADTRQAQPQYFSELGECSAELSENEIYHIAFLYGKDSRFLKAAACDSIRKRFADITVKKDVLQSRDDLLRSLREQIESSVDSFVARYQSVEVEKFTGELPKMELPGI